MDLVACPMCHAQYRISYAYDGRVMKCGKCDRPFRIGFEQYHSPTKITSDLSPVMRLAVAIHEAIPLDKREEWGFYEVAREACEFLASHEIDPEIEPQELEYALEVTLGDHVVTA